MARAVWMTPSRASASSFAFASTSASSSPRREFHVAPMRDYTDRHHRRLTRLLTRESTLWSEMEKARAILRAADTSDRKLSRLLRRGSPGGREVLQLGGDDPDAVGAAAALALDFDYSEINLNCGCPAVETGGGDFGASLMRDPSRAAAVIAAIHRVADPRGVPISVKCRVGVAETADDVVPEGASHDEIEAALAAPLRSFVLACVDAGARGVVLHCREAVMAGLSPRANRDAPPLRPELAARLARELRGERDERTDERTSRTSRTFRTFRTSRTSRTSPSLVVPVPVPVTLNGGISSIAEASDAVTRAPELAGVQVGRWALRKPLDMLAVDAGFYGGDARADGRLGLGDVDAAVDAVESYVYRYAVRELETGEASLGALARPLALVLADADERANAADDREEAAAAEAVARATLSCFGALAEGGRGAGGERDEQKLRRALAKAVGKKVAGKQRGARAEAASAANRRWSANGTP